MRNDEKEKLNELLSYINLIISKISKKDIQPVQIPLEIVELPVEKNNEEEKESNRGVVEINLNDD